MRHLPLFLAAIAVSGCGEPFFLSSIKPGPDGYISWVDAKCLLRHPNAKAVSQSHSRVIVIIMRDGKQYKAREPKIDDAWRFIEANNLRGQVDYATE